MAEELCAEITAVGKTGLGLRENPGGVYTGLGQGSPWGRLAPGGGN